MKSRTTRIRTAKAAALESCKDTSQASWSWSSSTSVGDNCMSCKCDDLLSCFSLSTEATHNSRTIIPYIAHPAAVEVATVVVQTATPMLRRDGRALMQSGIMRPGHQPQEGPCVIAHQTNRGIGQWCFLVNTIIRWFVSMPGKVRTCFGICVTTKQMHNYKREMRNTTWGCIPNLLVFRTRYDRSYIWYFGVVFVLYSTGIVCFTVYSKCQDVESRFRVKDRT